MKKKRSAYPPSFRSFGAAYIIQSFFALIHVFIFIRAIFGPFFITYGILNDVLDILFFACPALLIGPELAIVIIGYSLKSKTSKNFYNSSFLVEYSNRLLVGLLFLITGEALFYIGVTYTRSDYIVLIFLGISMLMYIIHDFIGASNWDFFSSFVTRFEKAKRLRKLIKAIRVGLQIDVVKNLFFGLVMLLPVQGVLSYLMNITFFVLWFGTPFVVYISEIIVSGALLKFSKVV